MTLVRCSAAPLLLHDDHRADLDLIIEMAKLQPRVLQPAVEQRRALNMTDETIEQAKKALAREGRPRPPDE